MGLFTKKRAANERPTLDWAKSDAVQNAADTLLANIRFSEVDKPVKVIAVTSPAPNDGKTTVSMALAFAMGRIGKKVALVEGDMRRRSLRRALDVKARYGIHAVLSGECSLEEALVGIGEENVFLLDAEQGIPNPESILNSKRYEDMLAQLSEKFDYVVVDTPPVTAFADACLIASKADGTVLVVREGVTEKREAVYAADALRKADANILGVSVNCQNKSGGSGYYGYYYSYYYEEKEVPADSPEAESARKSGKVVG